MPNRRRSTGPRAPPKLFRCTGYGNCNMVFTRSEHLARHERKHTGEKPYKCVVPGCDRMFSRFDNMMQHTQTHEKNRKGSSRASLTAKVTDSQRIITKTPTPIETDDDKEDHLFMMHSRTLPLPTRRSSLSTFNNDYRPSYSNAYEDTPRNRLSWPMRIPYPYYNPYNNEPDSDRRRSSISTVSSEASSLISPTSANFPISQRDPETFKRRISIDDLRLPIEDLKNINLEEKSYSTDKTVCITTDELEALEGFSKFHSTSVIATEPSKVFGSPNFASQVNAMRQRVMTSNESYLRG